MIQRIQTLYLLIATALMAVTIFTPMAQFFDGTQEYTLTAFALKDAAGVTAQPTIYMGILLALAGVLPFIVIFLFKNRQLQIRLCAAEIVLLVGSLVVMGIYYYLSARLFDSVNGLGNLKLGVIMPLLSIVFVALATRAIFRDEVLVRSLDRIR
ncbi:MAG: DUF4293 domain-containing protein [Alistipes sp.]|nr:DUF4293 domain-containing protein [Alistipes sp.]MBQ3246951.1 DUF4293 domain-containing protein [Alistipes sp.]